MDTLRAFSGWVLFLIMAVIAAFFWQQSDARGRRIEELTRKMVEIDAQINYLGNELAQLRDYIADAESQAREMQHPVEENGMEEPQEELLVPLE